MIPAGSPIVLLRAEGGELREAHARASSIVRRRPESADAHFTLSYVLRYGGMLEEALEAAVDGGYCAYPALDLDPLWQRARDHATFLQLRERAIDCRDEFRQAVESRGLSRES